MVWLIWLATNTVSGPYTRKQANAYLQAGGWKGPYPTRAAAERAAHGGGGGGGGGGGRKKKGRKVSGAEIIARARTWLGVPYLYGGTSRQGVDCSGLIMQVAHSLGITSCPRTSEEQWTWCEHIQEHQAGTGDLVFFVGAPIDPPPGHVGFISTPGTMINAPFTGTVVRYDHYANGSGSSRIIGYGRLRGATSSKSANPYTGPAGGKGTTGGAVSGGSAAGAAIGSVVVTIAVIVLLLGALVLLLGMGYVFAGG